MTKIAQLNVWRLNVRKAFEAIYPAPVKANIQCEQDILSYVNSSGSVSFVFVAILSCHLGPFCLLCKNHYHITNTDIIARLSTNQHAVIS